MSNGKVFKNYQVNLGIPFQVKSPLNFQNIKMVNTLEELEPEKNIALKFEAEAKEIIANAKEEADLIIKEAHYEAARTLENAEKKANESKLAIEEEARQIGYNEGYHEGKSQYENLVQEMELMKEQANLEYKEVLAGIEEDAINVILDIARNVIGAELSIQKDDILYLIRQAFEKCSNKETVVLKISPGDYDYVIANKEQLLKMAEGVGELKVKKDNSLEAGGCIIETPYGSIDASVQTKMKKIEDAFRSLIGK